MVLTEWIETIKRSKWFQLAKLLANFWKFLAILGSILLFFGNPFSSPDLSVNYELLDLIKPTQTQTAWESIRRALSDSLAEHAVQMSRYFGCTQGILIEIQNNTSEAITDLNITLVNAVSLIDASVDSRDSRLYSVRDSLARFDKQADGTFSFPAFSNLPPRGELTLVVWGSFRPRMFTLPISVKSSAKSLRVQRSATASGPAVFISENMHWLVFLILVLSLVAGFKRIKP